MSIKLMSQVWEIELPHSQQSVLLAMADVANDDGERCYPSHPYLAWKTGYSERQVARIIQQLIDEGIVKVMKLGTNIHPPHYRICIEKGTKKEAYELVRLRSKEAGGDNLSPLTESGDDILSPLGATNETLGATNATVGGDKLSPDPLVNHYRDPLEQPLTESNGAKAPAPPSDLKQIPAVQAYHDLHRRYPTTAQMQIIAECNPPLDDWIRAMRAWAGKGHKPTNIDGILDWAFDPSRYEDQGGPYESRYSERTPEHGRGSYRPPPEIDPLPLFGDSDELDEATEPPIAPAPKGFPPLVPIIRRRGTP